MKPQNSFQREKGSDKTSNKKHQNVGKVKNSETNMNFLSIH